jgi:Flp pilus assembly protein CpaB
MAWGRSNNYYGAPPPTPSALSKVAPLLIFFALVGVVAVVLWHVAKTVGDIANNAGKQLEGKHVLVTKEGVTVGVKEMKNEKYVDRAQRCV